MDDVDRLLAGGEVPVLATEGDDRGATRALVVLVRELLDVRLGQGLDDLVCAGAAVRSWVAPDRAGEAQIGRPKGSVITCTFMPWHLCLPEQYGRSAAIRSMGSSAPSRMTNALAEAAATASSRVGQERPGR